MATFKDYINVEQADYANIPTEKIDLRKFSEASLSAAPGISNIKPSLTGNGNSFINKQYMMISFALSRDDAETLALRYNTPRLYLSIRGTDYKGDSKIINIYSNKDNDGDRFALRWDGNFGIGRVKVNVSDIIDLNKILEIGICITRESQASEMIGKFFCFGEADHDISFTVNGNTFDDKTITKFHQINKYASDYGAGSGFTDYVQISPQSIKLKIEIKGTSTDNRTYKNTKYYYNEIFCPSIEKQLFNVYKKPTNLCLYKVNEEGKDVLITDTTFSNDGFYISSDNFNSKNTAYYVYGGYQYEVTIKNTLKDFASFNDIINNPDWKEEFFDFFSFQGERYRTKFIGFSFSDNIQKVNLNTTKVAGILNSIQDSDCPYTTDFFLISASVISRPKSVEISYNENGGPLSNLSHYYTRTINLINLFTSKTEEVGINIPLEDEYQYYLLGEDIQLSNTTNNNQKVSVLGEQEFVWYADANLNVIVDNAYLYNVVDNNFIKVISDETAENKNEIWIRHESRVPLDNPPKESHIFKEEELSADNDKTLFQYWFWKYDLGEGDITEKVKRLENFPYYTVIRCLDDSSDRVSFKDNIVTFSDGKINYEFDQPLGDKNSEFSYLDFLRYAIDKNKSIRLSQKIKNRQEKLEIYGRENGALIGYLQSNENDYRELLQYFYTNIKQSLSLSDLIDFNNGALAGQTGIRLKYLIEYNTEYIQIIFEKEVSIKLVNGIRPLGLRRNGIIINPVDISEDLPDKTFGKINAFVDPVADYTYTDDNENERQRYDRANLLSMKVYDKSGNPVTDRQNNIAENTIYYGQNETGYSGWYFDGVNIKDLERQTISNSDSLKNQIKNNNDNINLIIPHLQSITISEQIVSLNGGGTNGEFNTDNSEGPGNLTTYFTVPEGSICIPQLLIEYIAGNTDNFAEKLNTTIYESSVSGTTCTVKYGIFYPKIASTLGNHFRFYAKMRLISIKLPTFTTATSAFLMPETPMTTLLEDEDPYASVLSMPHPDEQTALVEESENIEVLNEPEDEEI